MTQLRKFSLLALALALSACSEGESKNNTGSAGGASGGCPAPIVADATNGGCRIRLVSPTQCETIDLTGGKTYEFAWTSDGTFCETPWVLSVAGNPNNLETGQNIVEVRLSKQDGTISNTGGVLRVSAEDFVNSGLTSSDGVYHWVVRSFHGSHPASITFRVNK
jgi:hypothetical protein